MPVQGTDEVGVLSKTMANMTSQLKGLIGNLELRVADRTSELESALGRLEQTSQKLDHQANHDDLTGILNRRGFLRELEKQANATQQNPAHLFFLDLDQFKIVNDTCGHAEGDRLLCEVESDEIRKIVAELGADYAQGFGIHRPTELSILNSTNDHSLKR